MIQTEFTTFQIENSKWSKGVDSKISSLQSSLNDQISRLSDQKANKTDVADLKSKVEAAVNSGNQIKVDMDALQRLVNEFVSSVDAKIAHKADVEQLNDKMGRLETDDLLNQITNQLTDKLRKTGRNARTTRGLRCHSHHDHAGRERGGRNAQVSVVRASCGIAPARATTRKWSRTCCYARH